MMLPGMNGLDVCSKLKSLNATRHIPVIMVSESGASVYSASAVAREEFPDLDEKLTAQDREQFEAKGIGNASVVR